MQRLMRCGLAGLMAVLLAITDSSQALAQQLTVDIVNNSGKADSDVYLMLTGDNTAIVDTDKLIVNQPQTLAQIGNTFNATKISSARLVFSFYSSVPSNPAPEPNTYPVRFDKMEITYPGNPAACNLTAVDFFGIPFKLESLDANGVVLGTRTYYSSANTLRTQLQALVDPTQINNVKIMTTSPPDKIEVARIVSPSKTTATGAYAALQKYVDSVKGKPIAINGQFFGTPFSLYNMTGTFSATDSTITLTGKITTNNVAANATPLKVYGPKPPTNPGSGFNWQSMADAIYSNDGTYYLVNGTTETPHKVSDNDVYSAIYRDLLAGFALGYVNSVYPNNSNSSTWWAKLPFASARGGKDTYFNQYASAIQLNSDAYGFPFADTQKKVLLDLNQSKKLRITILPDDILDAPVITSIAPTNNSLTVNWNAVPGANGYQFTVRPPLEGTVINTGNVTSYTLTGLAPGTPYALSLKATNSMTMTSSEGRRTTAATTGTPVSITGDARWQFNVQLTGQFAAGETISMNGKVYPIPAGLNPAFLIAGSDNSGVQGVRNSQNNYVFTWKDKSGAIRFNSILYVKLGDYVPMNGQLTTVVQDSTRTFLFNNQHIPTYGNNNPWVMFLSIEPLQRQ
ncbi:MAG: beta-1,3-glucanase family protein [Planctomycetales bacterium]